MKDKIKNPCYNSMLTNNCQRISRNAKYRIPTI